MSFKNSKKLHLAVLGKGKTGGHVVELLKEEGINVTIFDRSNPLELKKLKEIDGVISFFPGNAFKNSIEVLVQSQLPIVSGSTGFEWPLGKNHFNEKLAQSNISWIHGHNFSLGMNIIKQMLKVLSQTPQLFEDFQFNLHEVHHTKKLDAPSGTALAWKEWLDLQDETKIEITHERTGDVIGDHQLTLKTPFEQIDLRHQALNRKIFAAGAIWALKGILNEEFKLMPGLHVFQEVAINHLFNNKNFLQ